MIYLIDMLPKQSLAGAFRRAAAPGALYVPDAIAKKSEEYKLEISWRWFFDRFGSACYRIYYSR